MSHILEAGEICFLLKRSQTVKLLLKKCDAKRTGTARVVSHFASISDIKILLV